MLEAVSVASRQLFVVEPATDCDSLFLSYEPPDGRCTAVVWKSSPLRLAMWC